jgi:hypothetical protein
MYRLSLQERFQLRCCRLRSICLLLIRIQEGRDWGRSFTFSSLLYRLDKFVFNKRRTSVQKQTSCVLFIPSLSRKYFPSLYLLSIYIKYLAKMSDAGRIFVQKRDEMVWDWRKLHIEELCNWYFLPTTIRILIFRTMRWAVIATHM